MNTIFVNSAKNHPVLGEKVNFPKAGALGEKYDKGRPFQGEIIFESLQEKERILIAGLRRGDTDACKIALEEIMSYGIGPGTLENLRFKAIELLVLLSRAAVANNTDSEKIFDINNRYLKRIDESKTNEELLKNLRLAMDCLAGDIFSFQGIRHASVLRKAERFIWKNYTRKLGLEEISKASGLSAPYFSTIFKEEMGENLSGYLNRLRVERAAALLTETGKSLTEISGLCGFKDKSWFSKIFKSYFGISPGRYREIGNTTEEKTYLPNQDAISANTYPLEKERELLIALKQGDISSGKQILYEIILYFLGVKTANFPQARSRAIELAVLLSRLGTGMGLTEKIITENRNKSIKAIFGSGNVEDLNSILYKIVDEISDHVNFFRGLHHSSALKKAGGYIMENFTRKISLEEIAKASGFSAPYFSTIFKNEMGENFSSYLNRLRVEKAKTMLINTKLPLSKVTRACGFEDQCWFSKIFKLYTGTSPGKFRSRMKGA
ncbi:MAG: helix-turn-helix domain-containing protein [Treponema sp.]|nr:helix-turn-helix domain-containing protein [Treponema sp.]